MDPCVRAPVQQSVPVSAFHGGRVCEQALGLRTAWTSEVSRTFVAVFIFVGVTTYQGSLGDTP